MQHFSDSWIYHKGICLPFKVTENFVLISMVPEFLYRISSASCPKEEEASSPLTSRIWHFIAAFEWVVNARHSFPTRQPICRTEDETALVFEVNLIMGYDVLFLKHPCFITVIKRSSQKNNSATLCGTWKLCAIFFPLFKDCLHQILNQLPTEHPSVSILGNWEPHKPLKLRSGLYRTLSPCYYIGESQLPLVAVQPVSELYYPQLLFYDSCLCPCLF